MTTKKKPRLALYHRIAFDQGFESAVQELFKLVQDSQKKFPGGTRILYLDIDGHKNKEGGYDTDMVELQKNFICGFLLKFMTKAILPIGLDMENTAKQCNDIPDVLNIS